MKLGFTNISDSDKIRWKFSVHHGNIQQTLPHYIVNMISVLMTAVPAEKGELGQNKQKSHRMNSIQFNIIHFSAGEHEKTI